MIIFLDFPVHFSLDLNELLILKQPKGKNITIVTNVTLIPKTFQKKYLSSTRKMARLFIEKQFTL